MESKNLEKSRENMYLLLSQWYLLEVEEDVWNAMQQMKFPTEAPDTDLQEGYETIQEYLEQRANANLTETLDELAVDYARIFLSAGVAQGKAAFPYESVYTSKKHLIMQDSRNEVVSLYAKKGLTPSKEGYHVPEDHIGYLFAYMAVLCAEAQEDTETATLAKQEQKEFLQNHLLNWVSAFTTDVEKYATTDFYRGIAKVTRGFLQLEQSMFS